MDVAELESVWNWYEFQRGLLEAERHRTRRAAEGFDSEMSIIDAKLVGFTESDANVFFNDHRLRLEYMTMLELLTATEGILRMDFSDRVQRRYRDRVSRAFRQIARREEATRVRLDEDILEIWKQEVSGAARFIGDFRGALRLRHWLAHGRYWSPKFGRDYTPADVREITTALIGFLADHA